MISEDTLKILKNRYQTTDANIRREYFQQLFLSYFYQQPNTDGIYFKGGTALRIVYRSPRFSEDLDFSSQYMDLRDIEEAVLETIQAVEKEGIVIDINESKDTSGGYLAILIFNPGQQPVEIQVQISFRKGEIKGGPVSIIGDYIPAYIVMVLTPNLLVNEKVQALLTRSKPRDFYDLYFLLRSQELRPEFQLAENKTVLPQALKILKTTEINFERELKQFLSASNWVIIRDLKTNLERELQRFL